MKKGIPYAGILWLLLVANLAVGQQTELTVDSKRGYAFIFGFSRYR